MAKIVGTNGTVFNTETLKNPSTGKSYLNGTEIKNRATGESYSVSGVDAYSKEALYGALRDESWISMVEPDKNEIYMLMHIYKDGSLIAFDVSGEDYTVELGTVKMGKFVGDESKKEICAAGSTYENKLVYEDFGDEMPDGGRQCMIKISSPKITKFAISPHSEYTNGNFVGWRVIELWCHIPEATSFDICNSEEAARNNLNHLTFLKIAGKSKISYAALANLASLKMVLEYAIDENVTNSMLGYIGRNCKNLVYFPKIKFRGRGSVHYAFNTSGIRKLEFENFKNVITMSGSAFSNNSNLEEIAGLDTSSVTTEIAIINCPALKKLDIDTSSMTGGFRADNNFALHSLLFKSSNGNSPTSISAINTALTREALCRMFDSLEYTETAKTVTITGAMGADELSESDIDIATMKGWSVVI